MMQCMSHLGHPANRVSLRALVTRRAFWHIDTTVATPVEGTAFKPYGQRLKESLP